MIRNVIERYLTSVSEREFDQPLLALLASLDYGDVHLVHGSTEFGKDIIAKRKTSDGLEQYAFQPKAGNINQRKWETDIQPQLVTALTSGLSHPSFDKSLPLKVVLVLTGSLVGNARILAQDFQLGFVPKLNSGTLEIWDGSRLTELLEEHGDAALFGPVLTAASHLARFYESYSLALRGILSARRIEGLAASWCSLGGSLLVTSLESAILSLHLLTKGALYESVMCDLGFVTRLLTGIYDGEDTDSLIEGWHQIRQQIVNKCNIAIDWALGKAGNSTTIQSILEHDCSHTSYLVHCARFLELASLGYFLTDVQSEKEKFSHFIVSLIEVNPGTWKPLSDRYAVTPVVTGLVLLDAGNRALARSYIERVTVWLCDRYEQGVGLAPYEASELEEVATVLGAIYDIPEVVPSNTSFLATAAVDLAAFTADTDLLDTVINELLAVGIIPLYWQIPDSRSVCEVEGQDIVEYPNVELRDEVRSDKSTYAEHVRSETRSFRFSELYGAESSLALCLLLRDRYFPGLWPQLAPNHIARVRHFDSRVMWQAGSSN